MDESRYGLSVNLPVPYETAIDRVTEAFKGSVPPIDTFTKRMPRVA